MVDSLVENSPDTAKIFYQTTAKTSEYQKNTEIKALPTAKMAFLILSPSRLPIPSHRHLTLVLYHTAGVLSRLFSCSHAMSAEGRKPNAAQKKPGRFRSGQRRSAGSGSLSLDRCECAVECGYKVVDMLSADRQADSVGLDALFSKLRLCEL